MIDVTAVVAILGRDPQREHIRRDRQIEHAALVVVEAAMLRAGQLLTEIAAGVVRVGLHRDVSHRTAFGARAIERALRATQHLDAINVDQTRFRIALVTRDRDDGYFVDVRADGGVTHGGTDAADGDVVLSGPVWAVVVGSERHARYQAGDVLVADD